MAAAVAGGPATPAHVEDRQDPAAALDVARDGGGPRPRALAAAEGASRPRPVGARPCGRHPRMTAAPAAQPGFELRTRVEWMDTDAAGIYHNSSVMRFVESAEAELMRQRGLDGYFAVAPRV